MMSKKDILIVFVGVLIVVTAFFGISYIIDRTSPTQINANLITKIRRAAYKYGNDNIEQLKENHEMYLSIPTLVTSGYLKSNGDDGVSYIDNLTDLPFSGTIYIYYDKNKVRTYYLSNYLLEDELIIPGDINVTVDNITSNSIKVTADSKTNKIVRYEFYLNDVMLNAGTKNFYDYKGLAHGVYYLKVIGYTENGNQIQKTITTSTKQIGLPQIGYQDKVITITYPENTNSYIYEYRLFDGDWEVATESITKITIESEGNIEARVRDGINTVQTATYFVKVNKETGTTQVIPEQIVKPNVYKINFDLNGGTGKIPEQSVVANSNVVKPISEPKRDGYDFIGWYKNGIRYDFYAPVSESFTLVAKWSLKEIAKVNVIFDYNNGTGNKVSQQVEKNTKVAVPSVPVRQGYIFSGWYLNGKLYDFNNVVTTNMTLVAKWKEIKKYTITFDYNDGTNKKKTQQVEEKTKISAPSNPTRSGYDFIGWYKNGVYYDFYAPIEESFTLVAKWSLKAVEKYNVIFNYNNGTGKKVTQQIEKNAKASVPSEPTRSGYKFTGWYIGDSNVLYNFNTLVTSDITLNAKWEEIKKYTVTFDYNDGTNKKRTQQVEENTKVLAPSVPTRNGYKFKGWYIGNTNVAYNFNTSVTTDMTLVAKWEEIKKYTVTFNYNDGTNKKITQQVEENNKVPVPSTPTRNGYTFEGWYIDNTNKVYNFNNPVISDITLIAQWKKIEKYTVIFDYNDGTGKSSIKEVEKNTKVSKIANPTREGYTFKGWYLNNTEYNFNTPVTSDIILTAKWESNQAGKILVQFHLNGGSGNIANQYVEKGNTATKPSNPTRSGYRFIGWYTSGKTEYNFGSKITSATDLYALWAPIIEYSKNHSGKWIFVNNPEELDKTDYLADSDYGGKSLYKDSFKGDAEIYYEHGINTNIVSYYAIRLYNPNSSTVTLRIKKCGAETGWGNTNIVNSYFNNLCSAKGIYTIQPGETLYIYHSGQGLVVGSASDISKVQKLNQTAIEGMISLSSSNTLYMSAIAFKDVNKTSNAVYNGNYTDYSASGQTQALVYSGYYNKLPIVTNEVTIPIYDQTPSGDIPISYTANDGSQLIRNSWTTNINGGFIYEGVQYHLKDGFVQDFINLVIPTSFNSSTNQVLSSFTLGPYKKFSEPRDIKRTSGNSSSIKGSNFNWANWGIHYEEKVTVVNNSSVDKTVSFNVTYKFQDNGHKRLVVCHDCNKSNQKLMYVGDGNPNYTVWTVTVPAGGKKTLETEITLMGHSNGEVIKSFKVQ